MAGAGGMTGCWWRGPGRIHGQNGEGDGFLGVGVDAMSRRGGDGKMRQKLAEAPHDLPVVDASAGGDQFAEILGKRWMALAIDCAVNSVAVAIRSSMGMPVAIRPLENSWPNCSRPAVFGRIEGEVGVAQHGFEHAGMDLAGARDAAVAIVTLAAFGFMGDERVDRPCCRGRCRRRSTCSGLAAPGITVMFAMPPILSAMRPMRRWRKRR